MLYPNQDGFLSVLECLLFGFHLLKDIITDSRSRHLPEKLCKGQSQVPSESSCSTSEPHRIVPGLFVLNQVSSIFTSIPFKYLSIVSLTEIKHAGSTMTLKNGNRKEDTTGDKTDPVRSEFLLPGNYINM